MGGPVGPPNFLRQSKNLLHEGIASSKKISLSLLSDLKVRQFGTVNFSKNGDESIIAVKNQLALHLRKSGDRRTPATPHEWPHPSAVSCNQP